MMIFKKYGPLISQSTHKSGLLHKFELGSLTCPKNIDFIFAPFKKHQFTPVHVIDEWHVAKIEPRADIKRLI